MKKALILSTALASTSALAAPNPSYSEIRLGFETIDYNEQLSDLGGLTPLTQSASVTNPTIRQLSYTGIDDDWGYYIGSSATIATSIDTEVWTTEKFGAIQRNDFKMKANEIELTAAYNFSKAVQFTFGARIHTSSFTRSSFKLEKPGAEKLDEALIAEQYVIEETGEVVIPRFNLPGQNKEGSDPLVNNPAYLTPVVSVSEDQLGLIGAIGVRYDSRLADSFNDFSWYAETEISTPVYSRTQSTSLESVTLTDSFNGWGVMARAGVRYQLVEHISIMFGVDAQYKERDTIAKDVNGSRVSVPNIEYSNASVSAGLQWSY